MMVKASNSSKQNNNSWPSGEGKERAVANLRGALALTMKSITVKTKVLASMMTIMVMRMVKKMFI